MKKYLPFLAVLFIGIAVGRVTVADDNDRPTYGSSGLPVNCRAYVPAAIIGHRTQRYTAEETLTGLERNCGLQGYAWKNLRDD